MKLWTINRVLRWTGFRLVVTTGDGPTLLSIRWCGLPGSRLWDSWVPTMSACATCEGTRVLVNNGSGLVPATKHYDEVTKLLDGEPAIVQAGEAVQCHRCEGATP